MFTTILVKGLTLSESYLRMKPALILLTVILGVLLAGCVVFTILTAKIKGRRSYRRAQFIILRMLYLTTLIVLICSLVCFFRFRSVGKQMANLGQYHRHADHQRQRRYG